MATPRPLQIVFPVLILLTGCALNSAKSPQPTSPSATQLAGQVIGGQQPVSGAAIQLYAVATSADGAAATPLLTSSVASGNNGAFTITGDYTCPSPTTLVYITATGGNPGLSSGTNNSALSLITLLGPCGSLTPSTHIMIDERTTVAAISSLSPFTTTSAAIGSSAIDAAGLSAAFTLASSLVDPSTGSVPGPSLPTGATAPASQLNTLANILAACINTSGGTAGDATNCGSLLTAATPVAAPAPTNTIDALLNIARDPSRNVASLFSLATSAAPFQPQLGTAPSDWMLTLTGSSAPAAVPLGCTATPLTSQSAFTNFTLQQPSVCRTLRAADLPAPYATADANNGSTTVARKSGQIPIVPPGFKVTLYATGLGSTRYLLAAANGDILLAQQYNGSIAIFRGVNASGGVISQFTFATGLDQPYGLAFYPSAAAPQYLYVGDQSAILRFPYTLGDTIASASSTTLATDIPANGNHSTRSLVFTNEATPRLLVGVGSASNITNTDTDPNEYHRANILAYSPSGTFQSIFASGTRNPVGLTLDPAGRVWISVNERDDLGDNLPADYVTHVPENSFFGWPWYYNGPNPDPRLPVAHPELAAQTLIGDTLLQPHFAPLQIAFYTGNQFPTPYHGDLFVASHGSWNKSVRGGYELLRVRISNGVATGTYEDFMTGFVNSDGTVWGRPAAVTMGADGALYVGDDLSNSIWRITYTGK